MSSSFSKALADEFSKLKDTMTGLDFSLCVLKIVHLASLVLNISVGEMFASLSSFDPNGAMSLFDHVMNRAVQSQTQ